MSAGMKARVDVFRAAEKEHSTMRAASYQAASGEEWICKCSKHYRGKGALERGRRHVAKHVIRALDRAAS